MTSPQPFDPTFAELNTHHEWMAFPGGELEAPRPKALCPACRKTRRQAASLARKTLCFRCYRMDLDRQQGIQAAANVNTASEARFQTTLPFEPVDRIRLLRLRAARTRARGRASRFTNRRRQAQLAARHALDCVAGGIRARAVVAARQPRVDLAHAANVQWPDLPYAVGR
ncbi:MAG: hypothetical protein LBQ09_11810 [Acidobacteriaceae bacterium]|jgi:hypothetical protein|nr:hypothetical protein [Acidobacteriaceae bacterium]